MSNRSDQSFAHEMGTATLAGIEPSAECKEWAAHYLQRAEETKRRNAENRARRMEQQLDVSDCALSSWAEGCTDRLEGARHDLIEQGCVDKRQGLFSIATGERIKARMVWVYDKYAYCRKPKWILLDENDDAIAWIPEGPRSRKQKQMGLCQREEFAPAWLYHGDAPMGCSLPIVDRWGDEGYPEGAVIYRGA